MRLPWGRLGQLRNVWPQLAFPPHPEERSVSKDGNAKDGAAAIMRCGGTGSVATLRDTPLRSVPQDEVGIQPFVVLTCALSERSEEAFVCWERGSAEPLFLRFVASHERLWRAALPATRSEQKIHTHRVGMSGALPARHGIREHE